jgi:hypothetical protein
MNSDVVNDPGSHPKRGDPFVTWDLSKYRIRGASISYEEIIQYVVNRPTVHFTKHFLRGPKPGKGIRGVEIDLGPSHELGVM